MSKFLTRVVIQLAAAAFMLVTSFAFIPDGDCSQVPEDLYSEYSDSKIKEHVVREGDTLYDIAINYGLALNELMRENNLSGSLIRPGEILVLPVKGLYAMSMSRGEISRDELLLLARVIHAEARGESFEGMVAVGAVIMNRLESPHFPKSIRDIVYQKNNRVYQFSPVADGSINLEPDEKAYQAAVQALSGKYPTGGALFFYNPDISSDQWIKTLPVVTRIGNHVFATSL